MIYLDYTASTPVDEDVLDLYFATCERFYANKTSNHEMGFVVKDLIDGSNKRISSLLDIKQSEVIYTSSIEEANNLVIKGIAFKYKNRGKHIIISSLEDISVFASISRLKTLGFEIDVIDVEDIIDLDKLKSMIREDTVLVSVCSVDHKLGLKQPIESIGNLLKDYPNTYFHTDASNAIGKVKIDYSDVDLITINPGKFGCVQGISVLVKKEGIELTNLIDGGNYINTSAITALSLALDKSIANLDKRNNYIKQLYDKVFDHLKDNKKIKLFNKPNSLFHTLYFSIDGVSSKDMVFYLSEKNIFVSEINDMIRVSFSYMTTKDELDIFLEVLDDILKENNNEEVK